MAAAVFEQVDGAVEVVFDDLAAARFAVHAREHARVRGGVDEPIGGRQRFQVAGVAHVAVVEAHAPRAEGVAVALAAGADEIIHARDFGVGLGVEQRMGDAAAYEAADAGDQDFHGAPGAAGSEPKIMISSNASRCNTRNCLSRTSSNNARKVTTISTREAVPAKSSVNASA